jgi:hypothetical protein
LYVPFRLWFWWRQKKETAEADRKPTGSITKTGTTFYGAQMVVLLVGYAQGTLAPDTAFGQFVDTWFGRITYFVCVSVIWTGVAIVLAKHGYRLV